MGRSRFEVEMEMLTVIGEHQPIRLTPLFGKLNIDYISCKGYLKRLMSSDLVERIDLYTKRNKKHMGYAYILTELGASTANKYIELVRVVRA